MQTNRVWWQRRPALLLRAVIVVAVAGCANRRETGDAGLSVSRHELAGRSLHVVRVRTMNDSLAGIPIAGNIVATARGARQDLDAAVVDSVPMPDHTAAFDGKTGVKDSERPWRIFWGSSVRFALDPLNPDLELAPGQEVLLAGFDAEPSNPRRSTYWTRPVRTVTANVESVAHDGTVAISAPFGN